MHPRSAGNLVKRIVGLCIAAGVACTSVPHATSPTNPCPVDSTITTQPYDSAFVSRLAGEYRVTIVSDWEDEQGQQVTGRLVLQPTDTLHALHEQMFTGRWRRTDSRPLWGWAEVKPKNVTLPWSADPTSRDPEHPGVLFHSNGLLELGVWRGLDGSTVSLMVQSTSPTGFAGTWDSDLGIAVMTRDGRQLPNPHGHFCAFRR